MLSLKALNTQLVELGQKPVDDDFISLRMPTSKLNLLAWLQTQTLFPKLYWSDKDDQAEVAALGICHSLQNLPELDGQARYYGGIGFQPETSSWPEFGHSRFILPRLEVRRQGKIYELICNLYPARSSLQEELNQALSLTSQIQLSAPIGEINNPILSRQDNPTKHQWNRLVEQVISPEFQQTTAKVVLSRQTQLTCRDTINPWQLLQNWQSLNANCFQFVFQFSKQQSFIGCSPERLYLRSGARLTTEALAGTTARGRNTEQDEKLADELLCDPKIKRENALVLNDILTRLNKVSLDVGLDPVGVLKLKSVQHLKQRIHAYLRPEINDPELLDELHPTPAVGGTPKQNALDFICRNETYHRGWYAGAVGYLSTEQSEFSVAIRSALIQDRQIKLFAGAGIVAGSIPELEWQELDNKINTVLTLLK